MNIKKMKDSAEDRILYITVNIVLILFALCVVYPCIFVISASFSNPVAVSNGRVFLWPVDISVMGYTTVFSHRFIMLGYRNTMLYTFVGTSLNVVLTIMAAYPMARKNLPFKNGIMIFFTFTMFFNGGLVPTYMLMQRLGILNKIWVMMLPVFSIYNMVLMRTNFQSTIPAEFNEAAQIDGCSDIKYLFIIVLPLSKAVISVIALFYAVAHWNTYFNAMIYLNNRSLYPLQLVLRNILLATQMSVNDLSVSAQEAEELAARQGLAELLKYATIVVSSVPVIAMYPFVQRYFVKGIMIGSIKG